MKLTNTEMIELLNQGKAWQLSLLNPEPRRLVKHGLLDRDSSGCFPRYRLTPAGRRVVRKMQQASQ